MNRDYLIAMSLTGAAVVGFALSAHLSAQEASPAQEAAPPTVDEAMMLQARQRMGGATNIQAKMEAARSKAADLETAMRARAQEFARNGRGASAAQLRQQIPGNAAAAKPGQAPCADPSPTPPVDGPGVCTPGSGEH